MLNLGSGEKQEVSGKIDDSRGHILYCYLRLGSRK